LSGREEASPRPGVSGLVLTKNEERRIGACLQSLAWCDEVLVVDSYSDDRTEEIARARGNVRVVQHEYIAAAAQRNWAIPQCRHEWVFVLDADEVCPAGLRDEVLATIAQPAPEAAYVVRRRVFFLDRLVRFSGFQRDRVGRLFRRDAALYSNRRVHPRLLLRRDGRPVIRTCPWLKHRIDHYMVDSMAEYVERSAKYGKWAGAQAWRDGRRISAAWLFVGPAWRFFRSYVLKGGFLDGAPGLAFCTGQALGTYAKWAALWGWQVEERDGREPGLPAFDDDPERWLGGRPGEDGAAAPEKSGSAD
jgi:glycosyltransferase involved in cell wall biosynthesis